MTQGIQDKRRIFKDCKGYFYLWEESAWVNFKSGYKAAMEGNK